MAHDVLISYSTFDKQQADAICNGLESQGIRCWIAPRDVPAGAEYADSIVRAIDAAQVMVLVYSSHTDGSKQVRREVERAVSNGITIMPVRIEAAEMSPVFEYYVGFVQWLDAINPLLEEHIDKLAHELRAVLSGRGGSIPGGGQPAQLAPMPVPTSSPVPQATPGAGNSQDVLISYSTFDKQQADAICNGLESQGIRCWIAPRDMPAGAEYADSIVRAIDAAQVMVLVYSSHADGSKQVRREVERAVSNGITIMPVRIEAAEMSPAFEYYVGSVHWLDAINPPLEEHIDKLARELRAVLSTRAGITQGGVQPAYHGDAREPQYRVGRAMSWPEQDRWRAPSVGDWPPAWASAWGSDRFGLWADLVVGAASQRMRWIEPSGPEGFWMGSPQAERDAISDDSVRQWANGHESEPRLVVVEHGFWLADTPCTTAFWHAVAVGHAQDGDRSPSVDGLQEHPKVELSFDDIEHWLGWIDVPGANKGLLAQLPTEVQWEYAARAGTRTAYWWGDEFDASKANTDVDGDRPSDGSKGATTPVKRYPPNPWGLHDVHGNVWEWCDDAWRERLDGEGGEADPSRRVVRGGSWIDRPVNARSAVRDGGHRGGAPRDRGFRLSLRSPSPGPEAPGAR
ncbi:MAG: hypothetical protein RL722_380 [Pseudomonadota bacterium]